MKRLALMFFAAILLTPMKVSAFSLGEEVRSKLSIQNDFVNSDKGESFTRQKTIAYFQKGDLGFGGEVFLMPKFNYLRFRPYATLKVGPIIPIAGFSTDSKGADHFDAGLQYFKNFGNLVVFIDLRNYWGLNENSVDFTDNLLALSYRINKNFFTGVDIIQGHYWKNKDDWYLIGIPVGYKVTDKVDVYVRPTYEELIPGKGKRTATRSIRVGINISF